ncbi:MAG: GTP 3',8-cyclase MoaA [Desulfobacteraceae bacterium 4572_35.2]|nr:MAG: GTP 3',8-cyclase MoaA [Desulfobacteraceae bacterium 4572_35.2]
MEQPLYDRYQRKINYLRLSVTDRCNFRCVYCMPAEGIDQCNHQQILSYETFYSIAETAVALGIEKIRLTGGEPLIRKGILPFMQRLNDLDGLKQLVVTTNGFNLLQTAKPLCDLGIHYLNVSLDSLKADRFARITRIGTLKPVWDGLILADSLAIPLKVNMVVMRGINDDEIADFAALTLKYNWSVRFIEYMPNADGSKHERGLSADEIYQRINSLYPLEKISHRQLAGPATNYRIKGAKGTIGIISALSCSFCSSCNRLRVSSTGILRNCLFSDQETDLKPYLDNNDLTGLKEAIIANVDQKPEHHTVSWDKSELPKLHMSKIGG